MSRGSVRRRSGSSFELKFDDGTYANGKRRIRYINFKCTTKQEAQKELTRLLAERDRGTLPDANKTTVKEWLHSWLGDDPDPGTAKPVLPVGLTSLKTAERYRQLAKDQVNPHLGNVVLQKLRPPQVEEWHAALLARGGKTGKPLCARTVGHAHRVLHRALERGVKLEVLSRNVASNVSPPAVEDEEVEILQEGEPAMVLQALVDAEHVLHPMVDLDLATGMRRGELLALAWNILDLDECKVKVKRSLEETKYGLRFKAPKTKTGWRTLTFPASTGAVLREHRKKQLELRVKLGLGKPGPDALVFSNPDGTPIKPSWLSYTWRNTQESMKLPDVTFHAFRHTHASALIAAGLDVVTVSKRIGHKNPTTTLRIYSHLFDKRASDAGAAAAIEAAMRTQVQR
jgi:integrase